ncbi:hypothetical protein [Aliivibrio fischeri]|uniref:hypothetical protein n=1 Tax=Aliivibrio fischeri TaxID=668 RepID=UPI00080EE3EB|nr:hypothetical protein [Aliivibrio fischeri]OCH48152.1 hypothetical protein A6E02_08460 [Aliivibrio fischeri]
MKKSIIAAVILSSLSAGAFAAAPAGITDGEHDVTSATLEWNAKIPTVMPGKWVTITGEAKAPLAAAEMQVNADGSFTSEPVKMEVHYYDSSTNVINEGVIVNAAPVSGETAASALKYSVENLTFASSKGVDLTTLVGEIKEGGKIVTPGAKVDASGADAWKTEWTINNAMGEVMPSVTAGDTITATTVVRADVDFVVTP